MINICLKPLYHLVNCSTAGCFYKNVFSVTNLSIISLSVIKYYLSGRIFEAKALVPRKFKTYGVVSRNDNVLEAVDLKISEHKLTVPACQIKWVYTYSLKCIHLTSFRSDLSIVWKIDLICIKNWPIFSIQK